MTSILEEVPRRVRYRRLPESVLFNGALRLADEYRDVWLCEFLLVECITAPAEPTMIHKRRNGRHSTINFGVSCGLSNTQAQSTISQVTTTQLSSP
ncbi:hypothetical protein TNCV_2409241 [Trichonephila clavipes]|nr:hypothetical protein TNCV_2409241 [Trichonephila clavipes]